MTTPPVTSTELFAHLNITSTPGGDGTEVDMHLEAATEAIEHRVGPLVNREVTERLTTACGRLTLNHLPVADLTSVTAVEDDSAVDVDDLHVDSGSGVVTGRGVLARCASYDVTYTAGRGTVAEIPARFKLAVLIVAAHLWETQRGAGGVRPAMFGVAPDNVGGTGAEAAIIYSGYALPRRALELIAGDEASVMGFA